MGGRPHSRFCRQRVQTPGIQGSGAGDGVRGKVVLDLVVIAIAQRDHVAVSPSFGAFMSVHGIIHVALQ